VRKQEIIVKKIGEKGKKRKISHDIQMRVQPALPNIEPKTNPQNISS
jgi:hypothetical protein